MRSLARLCHSKGLLGAGLLLLPSLQACGGRSDTEEYLFGADPSGATGTGASSSTGARPGEPGQGAGAEGSGASGSGASGSGASGSGASGVGGNGSGGTRPSGEGGAATAGTGTGGNAQAGSGAAGAGPGPMISCGGDACDTTREKCCAGLGGFGCIPRSEECAGAVLSCTNSDDCPGNTVCCLRVIEAEVGSGSQCKAACQGMGASRERQLCSSDEECPFGVCRATVFGISVCTRR